MTPHFHFIMKMLIQNNNRKMKYKKRRHNTHI